MGSLRANESSSLGNIEVLQRFANGELTTNDLKQMWQTPKRPLTVKNFRHARDRFMKKFGLSRQRVNTAGNYLEDSDPVMKELLLFNYY